MTASTLLARMGGILFAPLQEPKRALRLLGASLSHPRRLLNMAQVKFNGDLSGTRLSYHPYSYDVEPNTICNFACEMCQTTTWDRKGQNLKLDDFAQYLDRLPMVTEVKLQGMGEPMLNKEYFDLVTHAESRGVRVVTISNGSMLRGEADYDRVLASGLSVLTISLDGATKETFERIRIKGNFDQVTAGIRDLIKRRGEGKPEVRVWMVGMKQNIGELPLMIELCHELGVEALTLQLNLTNWGKEEWGEYVENQALMSRSDYQHLVDTAESRAREVGLPFEVYHGNDKFSAKEGTKCEWPWRSVYITAEGDITPCCIIADPSVYSFGNLNDHSFEEIWNGPTYQKFRSNMTDGVIPSFCQGCYKDCHGVEELDAADDGQVQQLDHPSSSSSAA